MEYNGAMPAGDLLVRAVDRWPVLACILASCKGRARECFVIRTMRVARAVTPSCTLAEMFVSLAPVVFSRPDRLAF